MIKMIEKIIIKLKKNISLNFIKRSQIIYETINISKE
jgi:hypothetical protein